MERSGFDIVDYKDVIAEVVDLFFQTILSNDFRHSDHFAGKSGLLLLPVQGEEHFRQLPLTHDQRQQDGSAVAVRLVIAIRANTPR